MSIIAKRPDSKFSPAPEGLLHAVCVDVVDLGVLQTTFGDKHMVRLVWQVDAVDNNTGRRYDVRRNYNLSLHEKAALRKDLESWRGRKFTDQELRGFDLEKLVGANCQIQIVHNLGDDATIYANVQAVVPPPKGAAKLAPLEYVRAKDRPVARGNGIVELGESEVDDDPIPF